VESVEFEALLNDVETRLDRLKVLYEQWFQGMERLEPQIPRKEVERRMVLLRKEQPRNTALRFRFQTLIQRYTTLQTYWVRVARQIEEGTYRRDLLKARNALLASKAGRRRGPDDAFDVDVDLDASEEGTIGTMPPTAPPSTHSPKPAEKALVPALALPPRPPVAPLTSPLPAGPIAAAPRAVSPFARAAPRPLAPPTLPPIAPPTSPPSLSTQGPQPAPAPSPPASPAMATFAKPGAVPRPTTPLPQSPPPRPATPLPQSPAPVTFARPVADARPAAAAPPAESFSEQDLRRVYDRYAEARRKNNEPNVSYETLAKNLRDVAPKMREKFGKPVDFEVVLKDGKVGLKPVPKG
jgi:hypothetical protein